MLVDLFEDGWINHAAPGQLHPPAAEGLGAEIDLVAWFGEWEEMGAEPDLGARTEEFSEEEFNRTLEVG